MITLEISNNEIKLLDVANGKAVRWASCPLEPGILQDEVVVVGVYSRVEIWSQESWNSERSIAEEQSAAIAEHLANLGI